MTIRLITRDPETGDLILDLGDELCREAGLAVGDEVEWIDNKDGTWTLKKKLPSKWKQLKSFVKTITRKAR